MKKTIRREQIIAAAGNLFREKGYNASGMRMLAERMGMEAASLYNHISSKEELLKEICFSVAKQYMDHLASLEAGDFSPGEKVKQIILFQLEMMISSYETVYVSLRDWKHLSDPCLDDFLEKRRLYEKQFAAIITEGIQLGEFRKVDPYVAVLGILSAIRAVEHWQRHPKNITATVLKRDLAKILMAGLTVD